MPATQVFRASDGAEIAYSNSGAGEPALVFIHGWQGDRTVWGDVVKALGPGVRTIAIDQRGNGDSRTARGPFCLERFAADVRELVAQLGLEHAVVIGHSMGATVALRLAVDSPDVVRGLVLIGPVPASGGGFSAKGEAFLRSTAGDPVAVRTWLARTFAGTPDETKLDRVCAIAAKADRDATLESFESWAFADFAEQTRAIAVPVIVIAPEHDAPEAAEARVTALLPNAQHVVLAGAGHYAQLEKPREIAELIAGFALRPSTGSG